MPRGRKISNISHGLMRKVMAKPTLVMARGVIIDTLANTGIKATNQVNPRG